MHRRAVSCKLCGKAFFPASIKIHMPQCRKKQLHIPIPCAYCDIEYPQGEMEKHHRSCHKAKAAKRQLMKQRKLQQNSSSTFSNMDANTSATHTRGTGQTMRDRTRQRAGPYSSENMETSSFSDNYGADGAHSADSGRIDCAVCGRKFARDRIAIHQKICRKSKTTKQRRGIFNSTKQRLEGTDMGREGYNTYNTSNRKHGLKRQSGKKKSLASNSGNGGNGGKSGKWKQQSNALRNAMKHAKMISKIERNGGDFSMLPPPPPSEDPVDFIPCPHCGRTFNPQAGERHIEACGRTINKPSMLLRGGRRADRHGVANTLINHGGQRSRVGRGSSGHSGRSARSGNSTFGNGRSTIMSRRPIAKKTESSFGSGRGTGTSSGVRGMEKIGGFSTSNETSANNPLAYPNRRQSNVRFR